MRLSTDKYGEPYMVCYESHDAYNRNTIDYESYN